MKLVSKLELKFFQGEKLSSHEDERGSLTALNLQDLPFEPKRLFWITNVPTGASRGNHGHYEGEQFLFCQEGELKIEVWAPKAENAISINLLKGDNFFLPAKHWIKMQFISDRTVLMVIANSEYDVNDLFTEPIK